MQWKLYPAWWAQQQSGFGLDNEIELKTDDDFQKCYEGGLCI